MVYITDGKRHLVCIPYSVDYLHLMADILGIKRCWYHHTPYPHYDIPKRRVDEIEERCIIVSSKDIVRICRGEYDEGHDFER
jgi:hypothetical protein